MGDEVALDAQRSLRERHGRARFAHGVTRGQSPDSSAPIRSGDKRPDQGRCHLCVECDEPQLPMQHQVSKKVLMTGATNAYVISAQQTLTPNGSSDSLFFAIPGAGNPSGHVLQVEEIVDGPYQCRAWSPSDERPKIEVELVRGVALGPSISRMSSPPDRLTSAPAPAHDFRTAFSRPARRGRPGRW